MLKKAICNAEKREKAGSLEALFQGVSQVPHSNDETR